MVSCLWDGAYKISLAANQRVVHVVATAGFLSSLIPYNHKYVVLLNEKQNKNISFLNGTLEGKKKSL